MSKTTTPTTAQQPAQQPVNPDEYNGWPNYETWNVALWITNDQGSYRTALDVIRRAFSDAKIAKITDPDAPVSADADAADALQELVFDFNPIGDHASTYSDLLTHALGRVDWRYIVNHLREDLAGDEDEPEQGEPEAEAEADCPQCSGKGYQSFGPLNINCPACYGTGLVS